MIADAVLIIAASLLLQAFFAGSEMALISCSRIKVRHRAELGERRARIVQRFLDDPRTLLATTLVGYDVAVVVGSCVLNNVVSRFAPPNTEDLFSLIIYWPLILIAGQIVPMALGRQYANELCLSCARPLRIASLLLLPLVWFASILGTWVTRPFIGGRPRRNPFVTREEIELILSESHQAGMLGKEEKEMIEEIFRFGKATVRRVMRPLLEVIAAPVTATAAELRRTVAESAHSRIPIYDGRIDRIVGMVQATDLVGVADNRPAREIMRAAFFVPEFAALETVLADLRRNHKFMAVAVDEHGGAAGILTLEDIVEEIVGEIDDEYDAAEGAGWERSASGSLLAEGRMRIAWFNKEFGQRLPDAEAETLGGFLFTLFGKMPREGEEVVYEHLTFRVAEATDRRILKVEVSGGGITD